MQSKQFDVSYLALKKLRSTIEHSFSISAFYTTSHAHIAHVVGVRAFIQVLRINAGPVIAGMKYVGTFRYAPIVYRETEAMGLLKLPT